MMVVATASVFSSSFLKCALYYSLSVADILAQRPAEFLARVYCVLCTVHLRLCTVVPVNQFSMFPPSIYSPQHLVTPILLSTSFESCFKRERVDEAIQSTCIAGQRTLLKESGSF